MDVVFWNAGPTNTPYTIFRTLGPYKISHATRNAGYTSQVIDYINLMSEEELYNCTIKFVNKETAILGISTTFLMSGTHELPEHALNVLNRLTDQFPFLHVVFGGYQARDPTLKNVIKAKYSIILEYGEDTFVELLNSYKGKGMLPPFTLISRKWGSIKVFKTPIMQKFNIEEDNHLFTDQDCILPNETLPIEISRGCIFKCKFCNHLMLGRGKLDYLRSMECVKQELLHNYEKWNITNYYIICDTFNDTEYKMQEWHKMVTSLPFKIQYTAYLRADLLDRYPDVPHLLKESGLIAGFHGIETLSQHGSTVIGKGWSGKKAKEYIPKLYHDIWGGEVFQTLSFIVGLPGDTRETFVDTLDWFEQNDLHHMAIHNLGINNNKFNKHLSEFDLNAESYGYTFPDPERPWVWKRMEWDHDQVEEFINEQQPRIGKITARYGSWITLMLMQYGFDKSLFKKEASRTAFTLPQLNNLAKAQIQKYIKKILEL
jgi:hypothetical protein